MTVSYLDTVASVEAASTQGLAYAKLTRAMKVHVRSLVTEGHAAAFIGDEEVSLNQPKAVVCITDKGEAYVELLRSSGLLAEQVVSAKPKKRTKSKTSTAKRSAKPKRRNNPVTVSKRRPSSPKTVESPVLPEGEKARRVPGNAFGDQLVIPTPSEMDSKRKIEDLERKVSALMAVLAS